MVSLKTLSIFLSAGIFGLQALAGPIPNQDLNQIAVFKQNRHDEQNSFLDSLNGILRKRFSAPIIDTRAPLPNLNHEGSSDHGTRSPDKRLASRSLAIAPRAVSENIEVQTVTFSPEEKTLLRERLRSRFPGFDAPGLSTISPPGFLVVLLIIGTVGGALFMIFPVGWLY
ncbi:hypothetical protein AOL_s00109g50 [Orbilia oligospora ATCC 24927]|uniref:Uncharacterized protein n=1 Tax=Arthrobotrys oligospora (strain ATCC 24927 / CBS 115.81 / DSM 1491) TaxID=756982 RepID=G1XK21_ARTOA|nr:hypothetical protein AOL_s00109g50 [Orbilia oligospora ATCC 24927]EGX46478.1 hypothetical protein AOL_s00109g50 [Orbilia oligospora ATCC 24927]